MSIVAMLVAAVAALSLDAVDAGAAGQLSPDLRMAKPRHVALCGEPTASQACPAIVPGGTRLLRFSATIANTGSGPLQIHASRTCSGCGSMTTEQSILRSDGTILTIPSPAVVLFETEDGHHHWHVQGMEGYALWPLGESAGVPVVSAKYGFCFFDGRHVKPGRNASPTEPVHVVADCGNPESTGLDVGLSVGWGDTYPWYLYGQFIDVTAVGDGRYLLCLTVDGDGAYVERDEDNNQAWAKIRIRDGEVTVLARGRTSCAEQLAPVGS
ncbi:MAG TPA: lysyl oxidase family protein [Acidimicrobiia bacterium]|nr:lysyl oxidase family protein [Acidimicrobiia bacterium]